MPKKANPADLLKALTAAKADGPLLTEDDALEIILDALSQEYQLTPEQAKAAMQNLKPATSKKLLDAARAESDTAYLDAIKANQAEIEQAVRTTPTADSGKSVAKAKVEAKAAEVAKVEGAAVAPSADNPSPPQAVVKGRGGKAPKPADLSKAFVVDPSGATTAPVHRQLSPEALMRALIAKRKEGKALAAQKHVEAVPEVAAPPDLDAMRKSPLPKGDRKEFARTLKALEKGGKLNREEMKILATLEGRGGLAGGREIAEVLESAGKGMASPPGKLGGFLKSFVGAGGEGSSKATDAYRAEEALAKAGVGGFAKTSKAGRLGREALRHPGKLAMAAIFGLMAKGMVDSRGEAQAVRETPVLTAEEIRRRLDMNQRIAARRVELSKDPEMMNDVVRVLAGGQPERLTQNEVAIGRISQKKKPDEVQAMLNQLLLGMEQVDSVNAPSGLPF